MEIHLSYLDGKWETAADWSLIMDPSDEKKLAQLIQGTVSRFRDRQLKEREKKGKALDEEIQALNPPRLDTRHKPLTSAAGTFEGKSYKGLFFLHCPECGTEFWCSSSRAVREFQCKCDHFISLDGLAKARTTCKECGKSYEWHTNLETATVPHKCKCGHETTCNWDAKNQIYEGEK